MMRWRPSLRWKILGLRWWAMGAVYFFLGWGTLWAQSSSPLDLVVFLGLGSALVMTFVCNPILASLYGWQAVRRSPVRQRFLRHLQDLVVCMAATILVQITYQGVNSMLVLVRDLPPGTVVVTGEPFLFATLFMAYHTALVEAGRVVRLTMQSAKCRSSR